MKLIFVGWRDPDVASWVNVYACSDDGRDTLLDAWQCFTNGDGGAYKPHCRGSNGVLDQTGWRQALDYMNGGEWRVLSEREALARQPGPVAALLAELGQQAQRDLPEVTGDYW